YSFACQRHPAADPSDWVECDNCAERAWRSIFRGRRLPRGYVRVSALSRLSRVTSRLRKSIRGRRQPFLTAFARLAGPVSLDRLATGGDTRPSEKRVFPAADSRRLRVGNKNLLLVPGWQPRSSWLRRSAAACGWLLGTLEEFYHATVEVRWRF